MKNNTFVIICIVCMATLIIGIAGHCVSINRENNIIHTKSIIIKNTDCASDNLDPIWMKANISKIQDTDNAVYFIPNSRCDTIKIGDNINISYHTIRSPTPFEDGFPFNRIESEGEYP